MIMIKCRRKRKGQLKVRQEIRYISISQLVSNWVEQIFSIDSLLQFFQMVHTIAMKLKWPLGKEMWLLPLGFKKVLTHSKADKEKKRGSLGEEIYMFQISLAFGQSRKACIVFSMLTPHLTQIESSLICLLNLTSLVKKNSLTTSHKKTLIFWGKSIYFAITTSISYYICGGIIRVLDKTIIFLGIKIPMGRRKRKGPQTNPCVRPWDQSPSCAPIRGLGPKSCAYTPFAPCIHFNIFIPCPFIFMNKNKDREKLSNEKKAQKYIGKWEI